MTVNSDQVDVCVVGGGLIGLAVASAASKTYAGASVMVLDKETHLASHQSSHNSGVVHSGLYYKPGSLKARLCVEGRQAVYDLCSQTEIRGGPTGKLVIATDPSQLSALAELERRGVANGLVDMRRLGPSEITDVEPHATGLAALHVPDAGVADFPALASYLAGGLERAGARVITGTEVTAITHHSSGVAVTAGDSQVRAKVLVNCAGLHSDHVATLAGLTPAVRIVPFRGEYFQLVPEAADLVRALIYPVPDPRFPFLGVHFTRRHDGTVEVGPNAVLALGREHYRGVPPDWKEVRAVLGFSGFRKLARRHWGPGAREMVNSRSRSLYARLARQLVPELRRDHLIPGGAGVRAQAVDSTGNLVDDFVIQVAGSTVHVLNAPSPGATASIAIGRHIAATLGPLLSS